MSQPGRRPTTISGFVKGMGSPPPTGCRIPRIPERGRIGVPSWKSLRLMSGVKRLKPKLRGILPDRDMRLSRGVPSPGPLSARYPEAGAGIGIGVRIASVGTAAAARRASPVFRAGTRRPRFTLGSNHMASARVQRSWNRREVLARRLPPAGRGSPARAEPPPLAARPRQDSEDPYRPFKMGLQSYSLRGLKRDGHSRPGEGPRRRPRGWAFITGSRTPPTCR